MSLVKMAQIVEQLISATNTGHINWEEAEVEDVFQVSYPTYSIRIAEIASETAPDPDISDILISVYNKEGKKIESVSDVQLKDAMTNSYLQMKELYDTAKGYALGTEQALDSIIADLSPGPEDIPF